MANPINFNMPDISKFIGDPMVFINKFTNLPQVDFFAIFTIISAVIVIGMSLYCITQESKRR